jgi:type IV pilus assembly protein PilA
MKTVQKGFTLIELMIVIAIIGILAAIAIPAYQNYVIRSQVTEGLSMADGFKTAVGDYYAQYGTFPTCQSVAGSAPTGAGAGGCIATAGGTAASSNGKYVSSVDVIAAGVIKIVYAGPQASQKLNNGALNILSLQPGADANQDVVWVCGGTTAPPQVNAPAPAATVTSIPAAYLPASCHN